MRSQRTPSPARPATSGRLMPALTLVLALILAACGSGTDDGAGSTASTTATTPTTTTTAPTATSEATTTTDAAPSPASGEVTVVIRNFTFRPDELVVTVGTTVTWVNEDGVAHTTTAQDGTWDSGSLRQGESFTTTFDTPGRYPYICTIHPSMEGVVEVVEG